jgi:hypothetical protein
MSHQLPLDLRDRHPKTLPIVPRGTALKERFLSKVSIEPSGCWRWLSHIETSGYGRFSIKHRPTLAHRVAYELFREPIPSAKEITLDHLCHHRWCVNPDHLEMVDLRINQDRGLRSFWNGKWRGPNGTRICGKGHSRSNTIKQCPICVRERGRARYARNPEYFRMRMAEYRAHKAKQAVESP